MTREVLSSRRQQMPGDIARYLLESARRRDPAARFNDLLTLLEGVAKHVVGLLNSEYVSRATTIASVEAHLRKVDKPAFGDLLQGLEIFVKCLPAPWIIPNLSRLGEKLPPQCSRCAVALKAAIAARERFEVPAARVSDYVEETLSALTPGKTDLASFMKSVSRLRNDGAHKVYRPWWTEDPAWYALLNSELEPAIYAVMSWEPLLQMLTEFELVTVIGPPARALAPPGAFVAEVKRDLHEALQPLEVQTVRSDVELQLGMQYVVRRVGENQLEGLTRWSPFPTSKALREHEAKESYRRRFLGYVLNDGVVTPDERLGLRAELEATGLSEGLAEKIERDVWSDLTRVLFQWGDRSEERESAEFAKIADSLGHPSGPLDNIDLRMRVAECAEYQRRAILSLVEQDEVIEAELVARRLGIPSQIVLAHLNQLVAQKSLLPMGSELRGETRYYRVYKRDLLEEIQRFVADVQEKKDARVGEVIVALPLVFRLLEITEKLLANDGYFGGEDGQRLKANLDDLRAPTNEPSLLDDAGPDEAGRVELVGDHSEVPAAGAATEGDAADVHGAGSGAVTVDPTRDAIAIEVEGEVYSLRSVTKTLAKIGKVLIAHPRFRPSLPWALGRIRYFASTENVRPDGRKFGYEVPCGEGAERVWFEGNIPREDCAYLLGMYLARINVAARVVDPGVTVVDLAEVEALASPEGPPVGVVVVRMSANNEETREEVVGTDLRMFLGRLLRFFVDAELIRQALLPVAVSRSKTLVGWRPYHPSGKPFSAAVVYRGLFVETDFSTSEAFELAEVLFDQMKAEDENLLLERILGDVVQSGAGDGDGDVVGASQDVSTYSDEPVPARASAPVALGIRVLGREIRGATGPEFAGGIVGFLRTSRQLLDEHLPIRSGNKRYLVHSVPQHMPAEDGTERPFRQVKEVEGVFVETNSSKAEFLRQMLNLCRRYDSDAITLGN